MAVAAHVGTWYASQCTYRCVVLPDPSPQTRSPPAPVPQCTYRCVVLPDLRTPAAGEYPVTSQCTYRCVVLPDKRRKESGIMDAMSQCTYRCVVLPDCSARRTLRSSSTRLNAPTGAWCSLTPALGSGGITPLRGPGAPPAPGAPLRTGQHRAQSST